ncbi:MAG: TonB-dependent receptor [Candidatus Kapabacteria bacterium]|nr:TonB-dependent receptor [Ignavibacteriota bacterium]MCW5885074.1 TonB-dependent receptor [Candidatus Kapabacteria bacterium]
MKRFLGLIILLIVFSAVFLVGQEARGGRITGRIVSSMTQNPLPGVTVRVLGTDKGAISKKDGSFEIKDVPFGIQKVQFNLIGYEQFVRTDVPVGAGKPAFLEIKLVEKVIRLEGAEVKASYFIKRTETVTSTQNLNFEDIRRAPGVQEDVIRAVALLPGVNVTAAGRNDLIVRGGAPFENLFIVDGLEVNNINHFGSQGSTGGPLSIINLDFVRNVDFSAGGFGAKFGDKTSSVTNIQLRNGNESQFGGKATLSAVNFGLNLEGPIGDKGSWLFSARRSYLDFIFQLAGFSFIPQYWDYQGKVNYRLDEKNTLTFLTVSAINDVKLNNDEEDGRFSNSQVAIPDQYQNFSGLTWKHLFGTGFMTVTAGTSYTRFTTFQNDSNLVEIFRNDSKEGEFILRSDVDLQLGPQTELTFGNQIKYAGMLDYTITIPGFVRTNQNGVPQPLSVDTSITAFRNATYVSMSHTIGLHRFTLGGRMDYYNFTDDKLFFSPRLSYIYQLNENSAFIGSIGRYYQAPSYIWLIGDESNKLNPIRADQVVVGYQHTPLEDIKVQLEVFYKQYANYPGRVFRPQAVLAPSGFDDISSDIPFGLEPISSSATGWSRGAELFIQKKLSDIPIYGLFSVTYAESRFTSLDGKERPSAFDSRFIFNIAVGWRINNYWEVSAKFRAATGVPTSPFTQDGRIDFDQYNEGERLPGFNAADLRIDRRWNFAKSTLIFYIDIQNIYGRKNVSGIRWDPRTGSPVLQQSIGILPSIGISWEF